MYPTFFVSSGAVSVPATVHFEDITVSDSPGASSSLSVEFDSGNNSYWYVYRVVGVSEQLYQWNLSETLADVEIYATLVQDDTASISGIFDAWTPIDGSFLAWSISSTAPGSQVAIVDVAFRRISDATALGTVRITMTTVGV